MIKQISMRSRQMQSKTQGQVSHAGIRGHNPTATKRSSRANPQ
jgi:hypothetical protein